MKINKWIKIHKLSAEVDKRVVRVKGAGNFYIVTPTDGRLFDVEFNLIISQLDRTTAKHFECTSWLFKFGERWYYSDKDTDVKLNPFIQLGVPNISKSNDFPYLGVRGRYEVMNGSRNYSDWCKKAAFLGFPTLGISEANTLAGVPAFQKACLSNNIKPIIGASISIKLSNGNIHLWKFFAINETGWKSLLAMTKLINVDRCESITLDQLSNIPYHGGGLLCIVSTDTPLSLINITQLQARYWKVYYQLDFVEWGDEDTDRNHLIQIQTYITQYKDRIDPILIPDSFYLEQHHSHIKERLNEAGKTKFQRFSSNQHFKTLDELWGEASRLFKPIDLPCAFAIFKQAIQSTRYVGKLCNFTVDVNSLHLPKYEMNELESKHFNSNRKLFLYYIKRGYSSLRESLSKNQQMVYEKRLQREINVITSGGFDDYFLILHDIVRWARDNNILTGIGRGPAGGSLVAYVMKITRLDPIKYDLLFERFLNESRIPQAKEIDVVNVTLDDKVLELELDQRVLIVRNEDTLYVLAKQLQPNDKIICY